MDSVIEAFHTRPSTPDSVPPLETPTSQSSPESPDFDIQNRGPFQDITFEYQNTDRRVPYDPETVFLNDAARAIRTTEIQIIPIPEFRAFGQDNRATGTTNNTEVRGNLPGGGEENGDQEESGNLTYRFNSLRF